MHLIIYFVDFLQMDHLSMFVNIECCLQMCITQRIHMHDVVSTFCNQLYLHWRCVGQMMSGSICVMSDGVVERALLFLYTVSVHVPPHTLQSGRLLVYTAHTFDHRRHWW